MSKDYDDLVNAGNSRVYDYHYDYENKMIQIDEDGSWIQKNIFNALNNRVAREFPSGTQNEKYIYDGLNVIADYDKDNQLMRRYLTPAIDDNACMFTSSGTTYYFKDGLGSIRNLIDDSSKQNLISDSSEQNLIYDSSKQNLLDDSGKQNLLDDSSKQNLIDGSSEQNLIYDSGNNYYAYDYTAFGSLITYQQMYPPRYSFTGRELDAFEPASENNSTNSNASTQSLPHSSRYYYRARIYDSATARFTFIFKKGCDSV